MSGNALQRSMAFGHGESFEQLSVTTSPQSLTVPANIQSALVSVDGTDIRWRVDGNPPSTTVGHLLKDGQYYEFFGDEARNLQVIATTGTAAVAVTYYF